MIQISLEVHVMILKLLQDGLMLNDVSIKIAMILLQYDTDIIGMILMLHDTEYL